MENCVTSNQETIKKAVRRGDITLQNWVKDGTLIKADSLSLTWKVNIQEIENLQKSGKIFSLYIDGENYYPQLMKSLPLGSVIKINEAFDESVDPSSKAIFLMRKHGSLGGKTIVQTANEQMENIINLAQCWHQA